MADADDEDFPTGIYGHPDPLAKVEAAPLRPDDVLRTADITALMDNEAFKRTVWTWLGFAGIYTAGCDLSATSQFYSDGRRSLGLQILADLMNANPNALIELSLQHRKEQERQDANRTKPRSQSR